MPECNICVSERKESTFVSCPFCQFECCVLCFKKHLLTGKLLHPFCMNCNHQLDLDFVASNTSNNFYNGVYRDHRVDILFEYEKSLLPQEQRNARISKMKKELYEKARIKQKEIKVIQNKRRIISDEMHQAGRDNQLDVYESKINEYEEISELLWSRETEKMVINRAILGLRYNNYSYLRREFRYYGQREERNSIPPPKYVSRCFNGECKGFTKERSVKQENDESFKYLECELCKAEYCNRCNSSLQAEHKCDENDVLTMQELKDSTKPCPKCTSPIFKNGGCDQMFCTSCNTAFEWKSGKIVTTAIHNPHYFEYLRRIQQEAPAVDEEYDRAYAEAVQNGTEREFFFHRRGGCNEENPNTILHYMTCRNGINENLFPLEKRELLVRDINFIYNRIERYGYKIRILESDTDLRISYLNSEIDDNDFKKALRYRIKNREKATAVMNLLIMYSDTAILLMRNIYDSGVRKIPDKLVKTFLEEMKGLDDYTEAEIEKIRRRYGRVVPNIFHSRRPQKCEECKKEEMAGINTLMAMKHYFDETREEASSVENFEEYANEN